ncbi:MAG: sugar phosphate nucleotidyltransferase, partial [Gemmatimonadota bacterium]|nr:sugar phosphate nucleotidyltransferase [Gemmatimonadota bacterium]
YLILSGDHLYRMNYRDFIAEHREKGADLTIAVKPVSREIAPDLGILKVDDTGRIIDFVEKPQTDAELDDLKLDPAPGSNPDEAYMASMGIYVFEKDRLRTLLAENSGDDFGKHIIPAAIHSHNVYAHRFEGYWEDIGTIRAFYEANLALTTPAPLFTFYQPGAPIYTRPRYLAATKLDGCHLKQCKIGDGSDIQDAEIEHAVIGIRSIVGPRVKLTNTVMMGADFYETPEDKKRNKQKGIPNVGIGPGCVIDSAIIDKNARIGENVTIQNAKNIREAERDAYAIRDGIVVITKDAIIPSGTVI